MWPRGPGNVPVWSLRESLADFTVTFASELFAQLQPGLSVIRRFSLKSASLCELMNAAALLRCI